LSSIAPPIGDDLVANEQRNGFHRAIHEAVRPAQRRQIRRRHDQVVDRRYGKQLRSHDAIHVLMTDL